ncbi:MAG: CPBP family intramembrane glutamic endopeptidase [Parvularculaceae bacterium]
MRSGVFVVLAFAVSWSLWYAVSPHVHGAGEMALMTAYMFGPLIAALATAAAFKGGGIRNALALRFKLNFWWLAAWLAPPVLAFLALQVALLFPGVDSQSFRDGALAAAAAAGQQVSDAQSLRLPGFPAIVGIAMLAGILPNSIAAFGEEAGWRGVLWGDLRRLGFWATSIIVGVIWGLWHAPLIIHGHNYGVGYAGFPWLGIAAMVAFCVLLTPFMGYLRDRTGSVFPAAIFHGTLNAVAGAFILLEKGASPLIGGLPGLSGLIVLAGLTIIIAVLRPNRAPLG